MAEIEIEKVVLNIGAVGEQGDKAITFLQRFTGRKPVKTKAKKRIPAFNIRPGLEIGAKITLRKNFNELLQRLLASVRNKIKKKQVKENGFTFGIEEYIEIPGMEYQRDLGMLGLDVSVSFKRKGKRVKIRKIKRGKYPKKQHVPAEEIIKFMQDKFKLEVEDDSKRLEEDT